MRHVFFEHGGLLNLAEHEITQTGLGEFIANIFHHTIPSRKRCMSAGLSPSHSIRDKSAKL